MRASKTVKIEEFEVKNFSAPFIIAEIGANHNGDLNLAKRLIKLAKNSGAHAVKFQSWCKETLFSKIVYQNNPILERQLDEWSLNYKQLKELKEYSDRIGILFGYTPSIPQGIDYLVYELNGAYIKIASCDIDNIKLIKHAAETMKPVIVSTGMATLDEIDKVATIFEKIGNSNLILVHTVSLYPPNFEEINLLNIDLLMEMYPYPIGYSDHTSEIFTSLAAVARGASLIEKHFTINKNMTGWDHKVSILPEELKLLVKKSKEISMALGNYRRKLSQREFEQRKIMRRSIVAKVDIQKGTIITENMIAFKRPGTGLSPKYYNEVIGKKARKDIKKDEILKWRDLEW